MKIYIGIDPGASGGIAIATEKYADAWKMPETDAEIFAMLELAAGGGIVVDCFAVIERVHSMPGQGVASSFKFGENYGKLQMALAASKIPFERVPPAKWQQAMQCRTKGDKNVSKRRAQELFPSIKVTHAIADALLLAEYARRTFGEKA